MGQETAPAIPPKLTLLNALSLTRTNMRAPMDNGWEPVGT